MLCFDFIYYLNAATTLLFLVWLTTQNELLLSRIHSFTRRHEYKQLFWLFRATWMQEAFKRNGLLFLRRCHSMCWCHHYCLLYQFYDVLSASSRQSCYQLMWNWTCHVYYVDMSVPACKKARTQLLLRCKGAHVCIKVYTGFICRKAYVLLNFMRS